MTTDRERVEIQVHRQRIVQTQLDQVERDLKESPVALTIACPTTETCQRLALYGYHHAGGGLFRYGEPEKREEPRRSKVTITTTGWWSGFMWGLLITVFIAAWFGVVPRK